ncbi:type II secretion system F family protein [Auraticoccus monumenti]|uniref:Type II secretion system (T2SS), protein F n=1 Tax=Auraticoccus monumenti TaxID=675864 RepID=A0A1G6S0A4_9ACTN|nr:type II secretion system F family protein [Auraticoccus monumenti]SDD10289.1 Type II secretion system (T2SS), protein F [Auraticoccus monumenti]
MNGWALLAAVLAGMAAWTAVRSQREVVSRASVAVVEPGRRPVPRWWSPRPEAMAPRSRVLLAVPVAGVVGLLVGGPWPLAGGLALLAAIAVVVVLGRIESPEHRRRREALLAAWPQTWELLACCVETGLPLSHACRAVAELPDNPAAEVLAGVVARIDVGMGQEEALLELREDPVVGRVVADLARGLRSGTGMTELLVEHAAEAREVHHAALQSAAKAVGVRSVLPLMLCYLPAFFLIGIVPVIGGAVAALLP